jgi:hypothetical protein
MEQVLRAAADLSLNVLAMNDWPPQAAQSTDDDAASYISSDSNTSDSTQMRWRVRPPAFLPYQQSNPIG